MLLLSLMWGRWAAAASCNKRERKRARWNLPIFPQGLVKVWQRGAEVGQLHVAWMLSESAALACSACQIHSAPPILTPPPNHQACLHLRGITFPLFCLQGFLLDPSFMLPFLVSCFSFPTSSLYANGLCCLSIGKMLKTTYDFPSAWLAAFPLQMCSNLCQ